MKKLLVLLFIIFIVIPLVAADLIIKDLKRYAATPVAELREPVTLEIKRGQRFETVADMLSEKRVITHPLKFKIIARYTGHDKTMKFGEYRLYPAMTPLGILKRFTKGDVLLHRVTVPEGFNCQEVASRLESLGLCDRKAFLAKANDPEFTRQLKIPADTVEGYLFPDTYYFEKAPSPETIILTMVSRFRKAFSPEWVNRAAEIGLSVHEIVTLASIIEKETGSAEERPIISSVFHNRLKRGMRLDSDPTVIYGIEKFDGNLTRSNLREKTPYNTYVISGLPPSPIDNPGLAALKAALYPADTKYLFFVAKPDRTHFFSKTYSEHSQAVREYQLPKIPQPEPFLMGPFPPFSPGSETPFMGPTLPDVPDLKQTVPSAPAEPIPGQVPGQGAGPNPDQNPAPNDQNPVPGAPQPPGPASSISPAPKTPAPAAGPNPGMAAPVTGPDPSPPPAQSPGSAPPPTSGEVTNPGPAISSAPARAVPRQDPAKAPIPESKGENKLIQIMRKLHF